MVRRVKGTRVCFALEKGYEPLSEWYPRIQEPAVRSQKENEVATLWQSYTND